MKLGRGESWPISVGDLMQPRHGGGLGGGLVAGGLRHRRSDTITWQNLFTQQEANAYIIKITSYKDETFWVKYEFVMTDLILF
jgi:hypothetical protein